MANYNADIRVGITGKTQLNALERQLGRINKDLTQINKSLKAQTLTINTRGATRALDQLDRKIRRLSQNVNIGINERQRNRSEGRGGGGNVVVNNQAQSAAIAAAASNQKDFAQSVEATTKAIEKSIKPNSELLDLQRPAGKITGEGKHPARKTSRSSKESFPDLEGLCRQRKNT